MLNIIDHVSDMINKFKIAQSIKLKYIFIDFCKINFFILKILKEEGYVLNFFSLKNRLKNILVIYIKYFKNKPVIQMFNRISKLSLRIYKKYKDLPVIMNGLGVCIISTSSGVITDKKAKALGVGGEILCYVF